MLHFILGRANSGKTTYMIDALAKKKRCGTLFVVPEQVSHSVERKLCSLCGNSFSSFAEVTNFKRLATRIKSEVGGVAARVCGNGQRILYMYSAAKAAAPVLKTMSKSARKPGYLDKLLSAIDEFKAYGISPERLAEASSDMESAESSKKLFDLSVIYAAYEKELGEDGFDAYDELAFVAEVLKKSDFFEGKTVFFDGFSGFTAAELDIISAAIAKARDVYVALSVPENWEKNSENGIFDKASETRMKIAERAKKAGVGVSELFLKRDALSAIEYLDEVVFSDAVKEYDGDASSITVARASGIFEECELAAAYILDMVREKKLRFRDFSIAVTDSSRYLDVCERVLGRYGIPAYTGRMLPISQKPVIALVLAAFDCIERKFNPDAVMQYIKTGFCGIRSESLDIFENYIYTWNPKYSEWKNGDFVKNPFGLTEEETEESIRVLRVVNRVKRKIFDPIENLRKKLSGQVCGDSCAEALYDFINEINLPRRCNAYAYLCAVSGKLSDAQEYESVMGVLYDAIDSIGRALAEDELDFETFCTLFRIVISQYELGTIPESLDCVNISEINRADGEKNKVRLILGADDSSFPSAESAGSMLTDSEREELSDLGIELAPGSAERVFEEYRVVHNVLTSSSVALYISHAASVGGKSGDERNEAPVVSRICGIYKGIGVGMSLEDARKRAKAPLFDDSIVKRRYRSLWENDEEYSKKLGLIENAPANLRGPIMKKENISAIFGNKIKLSATRADLYSSCRYAYFLKYGLRAEERRVAEISPLEAGSLLHYVLENVLRELSKKGKYEKEEAMLLAEKYCKLYVKLNIKGTNALSARMQFLVNRLTKTVKNALSDICDEMNKSEFAITDFELKFTYGEDGDLKPLEIRGEKSTVSFYGAIDRVDTFEHNGNLYFRVVDYKTGGKEFSLKEAVNGIGMQMLLYMFALEESGKERYSAPLEAAGVMYTTISPAIPKKRGENPREVRREGVVLNDPEIIDAMENGEKKVYLPVSVDKSGKIKKALTKEQFGKVKEHMKKILADIGDSLASGEIEANPYVNNQRCACDYCKYHSICNFDTVRSGEEMRELCKFTAEEIVGETGGEDDE